MPCARYFWTVALWAKHAATTTCRKQNNHCNNQFNFFAHNLSCEVKGN